MADAVVQTDGGIKEAPPGKIASAKRFIVAIHGIGDQYENATIQTVVAAFGRYANYPAMIPLGGFRPRSDTVKYFQFDPSDPPSLPVPPILQETGFVEIYWANIPRSVQKDGYIIEESKAWARTIVARIRARYGKVAQALDRTVSKRGKKQRYQLQLTEDDYLAGAEAVEEMIQTLGVLDNLLWVAEKAGILKFDLEKLLTTYLGDVQLVADFSDYRRQILDRFRIVMDDLAEQNPEAEIHIVAHSEGTVVALLGLLEGMCCPRDRSNREVAAPPALPAWVKQVRGLMTFGSPIDKHLVLWPAIFDPVSTPHPDLEASLAILNRGPRIQWRNYYDYGDPVGYQLDTAHRWIDDHGWDGVFEFDEHHDHGFSRYLLPGAAHNNYWQDQAVFGHFITTVIRPETGSDPHECFAQPPSSSWLTQLASNVIPYLLVFGLIYCGTYLLYKGVADYVLAEHRKLDLEWLVRNVTGSSALLMGTVALARIPRLTRSPGWSVAAVAIFGLGAAIYSSPLVKPETYTWHALALFGTDPVASAAPSRLFMIGLAAAISVFAAWGSRRKLRTWVRFPLSWLRPFFVGARPLIFPGSIYIALIVGFRVFHPAPDDNRDHPVYPLILSGAGFLYLWWLAILVFDLVFVWHRYIRHSVAHDYLMALRLDRRAGAVKTQE